MLSADWQRLGIIFPVNIQAVIRVEIDLIPFFEDKNSQFVIFQRFHVGCDQIPRFLFGGKICKKGGDINHSFFLFAFLFRYTMYFHP